MIGLPTTVSSRMSRAATPARAASEATSLPTAARTARVIAAAPSGWSMAYETRLMRSSPKRICGFMTPSEASTAPSDRSTRWPAMVVEPTSRATPRARSWRPGQTAVMTRASWTATVTPYEPASSAAGRARITCQVGRQVGQAPLGGQGVLEARQVAARRGQHGRRHLDVVEAHHRVDLEGPAGQLLAHDLAVDLALRRHVDDDVVADGGGAGQAPVGGQAVEPARTRPRPRRGPRDGRPGRPARAWGTRPGWAGPGSGRTGRVRRRPSRCPRRARAPRPGRSCRPRSGRAGRTA